jgi:chromosome segregation ATPase
VKQLLVLKIKICEQLGKALRNLEEVTITLDKLTLNDRAVALRLAEIKALLEEEHAKHQALEHKIFELHKESKRRKEIEERRKKEAEDKCPMPDNRALKEEIAKGVAALRADLARLKSRFASLSHIDPAVAHRFQEAEERKADAQKKLEDLEGRIEQTEAELHDRLDKWRGILLEEMAKINGAFGDLMKACGFRGEVKLEWDSDRNRISDYRIGLFVAFDEHSVMRELMATRQSGGEKSVTTLCYLLALQDCSFFPFQIVDEINQGMDEINDRNTFAQVISTILKRSKSQYFLVTPKLLPRLDLFGRVTVLVLMNGQNVDPTLDFPVYLKSLE